MAWSGDAVVYLLLATRPRRVKQIAAWRGSHGSLPDPGTDRGMASITTLGQGMSDNWSRSLQLLFTPVFNDQSLCFQDVLEVGNGFFQPILQVDFRLPTQNFPRCSNVRLAPAWIVLRQRKKRQPGPGTGQFKG